MEYQINIQILFFIICQNIKDNFNIKTLKKSLLKI